MSKHVLLNNVDHKDLRMVTTRSAEYGDNVMLAATFPAGVPQSAGALPHRVP